MKVIAVWCTVCLALVAVYPVGEESVQVPGPEGSGITRIVDCPSWLWWLCHPVKG